MPTQAMDDISMANQLEMRQNQARRDQERGTNVGNARNVGAGIYQKGNQIYEKGKAREEDGKLGGKTMRSGGEKLKSWGRSLNKFGKDDVKKQAIAGLMAPAQMGTSAALKWAWGILIPSWGISLIYINIHVFLRFVLGEQLFCKLGHEWIPKKAAGAVAGEAGENVGKMIGIVEVMGVLLLDLTVLVIILNFLGVSYFIIDFYSSNIIEQVYKIIKALGMIV